MQVCKDVQTTLKLVGSNLVKLICNIKMYKKSVPEKDRSEAENKTFEAEPHTSSLLGMKTKVDNVTLEVYCGAEKQVANKITQRAMLSSVESVFDLLGFLDFPR